MIRYHLVHSDKFLHQHLLMDLMLGAFCRQGLYLLRLCRHLLVHQVDLLYGYLLLAQVGLLAGRRRFAPDIIEGIFVVCFEVGMFEFPRVGAVLCIYTIFVVLTHLVEIVLLELTHKPRKITMLERLGKY